MRKMLCDCLGKARAINILIGYGLGTNAIVDLAAEVASSLDHILDTYDRYGFEELEQELEGGAE